MRSQMCNSQNSLAKTELKKQAGQVAIGVAEGLAQIGLQALRERNMRRSEELSQQMYARLDNLKHEYEKKRRAIEGLHEARKAHKLRLPSYEDEDFDDYTQLYMDAAQYGDDEAQNWMGEILQHTFGGEDNCKTAVRYFEQSANQGNKKALYNLAVCYRDGIGVQQNNEAYQQYLNAASQKGLLKARLELQGRDVKAIGK